MSGPDGGGADRTPLRKREWLAEKLEDVPVVTWDRFVVEDHDGDQCIRVYGWIDRDDDYKDFVLASFWPSNRTIAFTTSSDQWSEYLHYEWVCGEADGHNPCRRVETAFDVENCIELAEQTTLTDRKQCVEPDIERSEGGDGE